MISVHCEHSSGARICACGSRQLAIHDNTTRDLAEHVCDPLPVAGDFIHVALENLERLQRYEANIALADKVNRQEDMEDVCRVLEEAGARFYALIEDCPEAVELNLTDL